MTLHERYNKEMIPKLMAELSESNTMAVPRIEKVVLNVGTGGSSREAGLADVAAQTLEQISGQHPVRTLARKSIAAFKVREGQAVGVMVTLRGKRMWDFLEKFLSVTLPRVRDFRGLPQTIIDAQGNCSVGFREHVMFPEVAPDAVDQIHGLQVTIVTNARRRDRGMALFRALGIPFRS
ncbi:MAG: 50S ribosomal protein L5 [bacterium]|nr:50S ribosomal protein L5 [bacterium]